MQSILDALPEHIRLTRQEEGCVSFDVNWSDTDLNVFFVYEGFVNEAAFDLHQARVKKSYWGYVRKNTIRSYEIVKSP